MESSFDKSNFSGRIFLQPLETNMKRCNYLLNGLLATLLLTGCMGYRLGGTRPEGVETVFVAPVINQTAEPAIELQVTHALRQRIQMDGRLKLVDSAAKADAIMEVVLTEYYLTAIAFRSDLETTPDRYRIRIDANSTLKNAQTGQAITKSETYGETIFLFESDLTTSKRSALPRAAQELAKFTVDDLIEQW
jgi:hypothetical protein